MSGSVLAVEVGLPPGLWLPLASEELGKFRSDVLDKRGLEYEQVVDFGTFATAMAVFDAEMSEGSRVSYMPNQKDFRALYKEGWGISPSRLYDHYGGEGKLQRELGFYPNKSTAQREEILDRCQWISDYVVPKVEELAEYEGESIKPIVNWAQRRHLLPSRAAIYAAMDGDTFEMGEALGVNRSYSKRRYSYVDLYRFGKSILDEFERPITEEELNARYAGHFVETPHRVVRAFFGNLTNFWAEFGYYPNSKIMSGQDVLQAAVRQKIANPEIVLDTVSITRLSAKKLLPSLFKVRGEFGDYREFARRVEVEFDKYKREVEAILVSEEVSEVLIGLVGRVYEIGEEFTSGVRGNVDTLRKLSKDSAGAKYVVGLLKTGFDLNDDVIRQMQMEDFYSALAKLHITSSSSIGFLLDLMPMVNSDEELRKFVA